MHTNENEKTPIVFVENVEYTRAIFQASLLNSMNEKNQALKTEFNKLVQGGMKDLIYIGASGSIGTDNEGTVDGTHLTDLGYLRYADYLIEKFKENKLTIRWLWAFDKCSLLQKIYNKRRGQINYSDLESKAIAF